MSSNEKGTSETGRSTELTLCSETGARLDRQVWRQEMYQEKYLLNAIHEGLPEDKRSKARVFRWQSELAKYMGKTMGARNNNVTRGTIRGSVHKSVAERARMKDIAQ